MERVVGERELGGACVQGSVTLLATHDVILLFFCGDGVRVYANACIDSSVGV